MDIFIQPLSNAHLMLVVLFFHLKILNYENATAFWKKLWYSVAYYNILRQNYVFLHAVCHNIDIRYYYFFQRIEIFYYSKFLNKKLKL